MSQKVKLTSAERMLLSIANTERQQNLNQVQQLYDARINSILETHGLDPAKDGPFGTEQDGNDIYLTFPAVDQPTKPELVKE